MALRSRETGLDLLGPQCRSGLTIVELLVTISIMALLFALLFPALQVARESARRTECANNLKQFALGMLNHTNSHQALIGWRNTLSTYSEVRATEDSESACVSWTVSLMPMIEELPNYDWYISYDADAGESEDPRPERLKVYTCPSQDIHDESPRLSYVANAGTGCEFLDGTGNTAEQFTGDGALADTVGNQSNSPFFDSSRPRYQPAVVKHKDMLDGTQFTILFTERSGPFVPGNVDWRGNPRPVRKYRGAISSNHTVLHPIPPDTTDRRDVFILNPKPDEYIDGKAGHFRPESPPSGVEVDDWRLRYPSSFHAYAVNVAFCDGHVEKIKDWIDPWVYCQLLSSGGKISGHVAEWQKYYDDSNQLVPYTFSAGDLVKEAHER